MAPMIEDTGMNRVAPLAGVLMLLLCSSCASVEGAGSQTDYSPQSAFAISGSIRVDLGYTQGGDALLVRIGNLGNDPILSALGPFAPDRIAPMRANEFLPTAGLRLTPNLSVPRPEIGPKASLEGMVDLPALLDTNLRPTHWCYQNTFQVRGSDQHVMLCLPV